MEGDSLLVSVLGRETKYANPIITILARHNCYGIVAIYSKEPENLVQKSILNYWNTIKSTIVQERGNTFPIVQVPVNLEPFNHNYPSPAHQMEIILDLATEILKQIRPSTKCVCFQVSKGRRALVPILFNIVFFFTQFKEIKCVLKDLDFQFITTPVPASEISEAELEKKLKKEASMEKQGLGMQIIPLFSFPVLTQEEAKILVHWEMKDTQKSLAKMLGLRENKVSAVKKKLGDDVFTSDNRLSQYGVALKNFYSELFEIET